mmetsp:Transcript_2010/g.4973  ORF Transcript_2010/g.4973 Transcript_2010/m.4973 type:complete len:208 (-) Transcript_2010:423-1046(-)
MTRLVVGIFKGLGQFQGHSKPDETVLRELECVGKDVGYGLLQSQVVQLQLQFQRTVHQELDEVTFVDVIIGIGIIIFIAVEPFGFSILDGIIISISIAVVFFEVLKFDAIIATFKDIAVLNGRHFEERQCWIETAASASSAPSLEDGLDGGDDVLAEAHPSRSQGDLALEQLVHVQHRGQHLVDVIQRVRDDARIRLQAMARGLRHG